ncbi:PP-loop domain protein [Thermodesulfatator indicus DSM 15286]|uniref:PP-loop domain protein n=1 Tax=Thermodesulfatator indicus (strain DSM 15286 / JCM 11887 / CIR29812) TaxID=667014 RepID=F8AB24_THEID|nr:ATP-binding protein [Thermodesulfatator indicus]AEH44391.1 PP-loop domain protein [Thermodesulfatator indicus DSM 15286]
MARCRKCRRKKADVFIPHHRLPLCEEHFLEWFEEYLARTVKKFKMFSPKAKILVAISGGKDSLVLWKALNNLGYHTEGLFVDLGIEDFSLISRRVAENFAEELDRPLHVVSIAKEIGLTIPDLKSRTKKYCSLCGSIKRYFFNRFARQNNFDVLVTGHNLDDEASSLLSNTINWQLKYLARKYPVLPEGNGFVRKAKPLCRFTAFEIKEYARLQKIEYLTERCPLSPEATRLVYAELMDELEEKMPGTKIRFYMDYLRKVYPIFNKQVEDFLDRPLTQCEFCGEPAVSSPCFVCKLKAEAKA